MRGGESEQFLKLNKVSFHVSEEIRESERERERREKGGALALAMCAHTRSLTLSGASKGRTRDGSFFLSPPARDRNGAFHYSLFFPRRCPFTRARVCTPPLILIASREELLSFFNRSGIQIGKRGKECENFREY